MFFGGSDVGATEALVSAAKACFFGPVRVSLMSDPNGSNTTAAAAVISVEKHVALSGQVVTVLAATGPVGRRIVELAATLGAERSRLLKTTFASRGSCKQDCCILPADPGRSHRPNANR